MWVFVDSPAPSGFPRFVILCSCKSQVPFGRSRRRFDVMQWVSAKRVVFVRGGRPNGMVHLLVVSVCLFATCAKKPGLKGSVAMPWPIETE